MFRKFMPSMMGHEISRDIEVEIPETWCQSTRYSVLLLLIFSVVIHCLTTVLADVSRMGIGCVPSLGRCVVLHTSHNREFSLDLTSLQLQW